MRKLPLTPKQKALYDFLKAYYKENGYSPTVSETAEAFCISRNAIVQRITALEQKGWIKKPFYGISRGITIV